MKYFAVFLVASLLCLATPDVAIYPGATNDKALTATGRTMNPDYLEYVAYSTADPFEKVDDFYKLQGGVDLPYTRSKKPGIKMVTFKFPGKKFNVLVSWVEKDAAHGTVIQLFQRK